VAVVRRLQHGGSSHFVIQQPDGTRTLLPAWMTEPWAAQIAIVKTPRLTLEALFTLRRTIDGALLSLSPATLMRGECNDQPTSQPPTTRSTRFHGQCARIEPNLSGGSGEVMALLNCWMAEHIAAAGDLGRSLEAADE
jgi:hypothetical protein